MHSRLGLEVQTRGFTTVNGLIADIFVPVVCLALHFLVLGHFGASKLGSSSGIQKAVMELFFLFVVSQRVTFQKDPRTTGLPSIAVSCTSSTSLLFYGLHYLIAHWVCFWPFFHAIGRDYSDIFLSWDTKYCMLQIVFVIAQYGPHNFDWK